MVGTALVAVSTFSTQARAVDYLAAGNPNAVAVDPAAVVNFADDAIVTVADAVDLANAAGVTTATTNTGTLALAGSTSIAGAVGASGAVLKEITLGVTGKTVAFAGAVYATDITYSADGAATFAADVTADIDFANGGGTATFADGADLTGTVTSTGGASGTLAFSGSSAVSGAVGASAATGVAVVNAGAAGKTVTFGGALYAAAINVTGTGEVQLDGATTGNVTFAADGTLDLNADLTGNIALAATAGEVVVADGADITGNIDGTAANGTVTFEGTTTVTGTVGATSAVDAVVVSGASDTVTFNSAVKATTLEFEADATVDFDSSFVGAIDNTSGEDGVGSVIVGAASASLGAIGATNSIKSLTLEADATSSGAVNADNITLGLNTLTIGADTTLAAGQKLSLTIDTLGSYGSIAGATHVVTLAANSTVMFSITDAELALIADNDTYTIASTVDATSDSDATVISNVPGYRFTVANTGTDLVATADEIAASAWTDDDRLLNSIILSEAGTNATVLASVQALQTAITEATDVDTRNNLLEAARPTVNGADTTAVIDAAVEVQGVADTRMASLRADDIRGVAAGNAMGSKKFWTQGYYSYADQGTRDGIKGYESDTAGIMFGLDSEGIIPNGAVGVAINYGQVNADSENANTTDTQVDSYGVTLYGSVDLSKDMFVEGQLGYAYNDVEITRHACGAATGTCTGSTDGSQYSAKIAFGKDFAGRKNMSITPKIYASYVSVENDGYIEAGTGAGATPLTVGDVDVAALDLGLDVKTAWDVQARDGIMQPSFHLGYAYDAIGDEVETTASFVGITTAGTSFKTTGAEAARSKFVMGAGFTYETNADWDVSAKYDAVLKEDYYSHNGTVRFTTRF